jgi:hypothetical protein
MCEEHACRTISRATMVPIGALVVLMCSLQQVRGQSVSQSISLAPSPQPSRDSHRSSPQQSRDEPPRATGSSYRSRSRQTRDRGEPATTHHHPSALVAVLPLSPHRQETRSERYGPRTVCGQEPVCERTCCGG